MECRKSICFYAIVFHPLGELGLFAWWHRQIRVSKSSKRRGLFNAAAFDPLPIKSTSVVTSSFSSDGVLNFEPDRPKGERLSADKQGLGAAIRKDRVLFFFR